METNYIVSTSNRGLRLSKAADRRVAAYCAAVAENVLVACVLVAGLLEIGWRKVRGLR